MARALGGRGGGEGVIKCTHLAGVGGHKDPKCLQFNSQQIKSNDIFGFIFFLFCNQIRHFQNSVNKQNKTHVPVLKCRKSAEPEVPIYIA